MGLNDLTLEIYSGTDRVGGSENDLRRAQGIQFSTYYPGGLYGDASFYVPRDVLASWQVSGAKRVAFFNGQKCVYEGRIQEIPVDVGAVDQGSRVMLAGFWGSTLNRRRWRKIWVDNRLSEDAWVWDETVSGADMTTVDRNNRIRFVPKAEAFVNPQIAGSVVYTMPTGETIKRVTCNYNLQEAAQAWELRLRDTVGAADIWSVTTSGSGSQDDTLATPRQTLAFQLISRGVQTPPSDGTIYGQVSAVRVYSETGSINLTEICKDIVGNFTGILNSSMQFIGSNTLSLVPFYADDFETLAEIAERAADFGDSSYNPWAVGVLESFASHAPNGEPVFYAEQVPALTGYDYAVNMADKNLTAPVGITQDLSDIWNWIVVKYRADTGRTVYISPDDDATLTDSVSAANYGTRAVQLDVPTSSSTTAVNYGKRYLADHKDPKYIMGGSLKVKGYIRSSSGAIIPACQVRAGKRVRIENYLQDLSGTGLTFLITATRYSADDETCTMEMTRPTRLPVVLARLQG